MSEIRPEGHNGHDDTDPQAGARHSVPRPPKGTPGNSRKPVPPSEERCLNALDNISGLLLGGAINTSQANVVRGVYSTMLQHLRQRGTGNSAPVISQTDLVEQIRKNPKLINSFAAILPQEQIDEILKEIQGDESEAA